MGLRRAILLATVVLAGSCGESPEVPPASPSSRADTGPAEERPSLLIVRDGEALRGEVRGAPRPGDPLVEIEVRDSEDLVLARGPGDRPIAFELPPGARGPLRTRARYASGCVRERTTPWP